MIDAELKGKTPGTEDTLTSNALGLLALMPDKVFIDFLRLAAPVDENSEKLSIAPGAVRNTLEFWPWLPAAGEPDVRLSFVGSYRTSLVIEVKRSARQSGDRQLERYARGLESSLKGQMLNRNDKIAIVYLTHDRCIPFSELKCAQDAHRNDKGSVSFFWLSWCQLSSFLHEMRETLVGTDKRICLQLIRYLKEIGFGCFTGFSSYPTPDFARSFSFLSGKPRFSCCPGYVPRFLINNRFCAFRD